MKKLIEFLLRLAIIAVLVFLFFWIYANPHARKLYDAGMSYCQSHQHDYALHCFRKLVEDYPLSRWAPASRKKIEEITAARERDLKREKFGRDFWRKQETKYR